MSGQPHHAILNPDLLLYEFKQAAAAQPQGGWTWFQQHANTLYINAYAVLSVLGQQPPYNAYRSGYQRLLLAVGPHLTGDYDSYRWLDLLTLTHLQVDTASAQRITLYLGALHARLGDLEQAAQAFREAAQAAQYRKDRRLELNAYVQLADLHARQASRELCELTLTHLLNAQSSVRSTTLTARLYRVMARAYLRWGRLDDSIAWAQTAYRSWQAQQQPVEMAKVALTLSIAYRRQGDIETAATWLLKAADHFSRSGCPAQHGRIAYEYGVHALIDHDEDAAFQWMRISLLERQRLDEPHALAWGYVGMGLVGLVHAQENDSTEMLPLTRGLFDRALALLDTQWNTYALIEIQHLYAVLESSAGDTAAALSHLAQAQFHTATLAAPNARHQLSERLSADAQRLMRGQVLAVFDVV